MDYLQQGLINDRDGEFFLVRESTTVGATESDPCPIQKILFVTHEAWDRCVRVNRETVACLYALSEHGTAVLNQTALHILDFFDVRGSTDGWAFTVSPEIKLLVILGEKVEPVMLGEVAA